MKLNISEQLARIAITAAAAICGAVFSMSTASAQEIVNTISLNEETLQLTISVVTGDTATCCRARQSASSDRSGANDIVPAVGLYSPNFSSGVDYNGRPEISNGHVAVYELSSVLNASFNYTKPFFFVTYSSDAGTAPGFRIAGIASGTATVTRSDDNAQLLSVDISGLTNVVGRTPIPEELTFQWQTRFTNDPWGEVSGETSQTYILAGGAEGRVIVTDKATAGFFGTQTLSVAAAAVVLTDPVFTTSLNSENLQVTISVTSTGGHTNLRCCLAEQDADETFDRDSDIIGTEGIPSQNFISGASGEATVQAGDIAIYNLSVLLDYSTFNFEKPFLGISHRQGTRSIYFTNILRVAGIASGEATVNEDGLTLSVNISELRNVLGRTPIPAELSFQWERRTIDSGDEWAESVGETSQTHVLFAAFQEGRVLITDNAGLSMFAAIEAAAPVVLTDPVFTTTLDKENLRVTISVTSTGGHTNLRCCLAEQDTGVDEFDQSSNQIFQGGNILPANNFISGASGMPTIKAGDIAVYNLGTVLNASFVYSLPFASFTFRQGDSNNYFPAPLRVAGIASGEATVDKDGLTLSVNISDLTNVVGRTPIPEELSFEWQMTNGTAIVGQTMQTYTAAAAATVQVQITDRAGATTFAAITATAEVVVPDTQDSCNGKNPPQGFVSNACVVCTADRPYDTATKQCVTRPAVLELNQTNNQLFLLNRSFDDDYAVYRNATSVLAGRTRIGAATFSSTGPRYVYDVELTVGFDFSTPFYQFSDGTAESNILRVAGISAGAATIAKNSLVLSVNISALRNVLDDAPKSHELTYQWQMPDNSVITDATGQTYTVAAAGATVQVQITDKAGLSTFAAITATAGAAADTMESCNLAGEIFDGTSCVACPAGMPDVVSNTCQPNAAVCNANNQVFDTEDSVCVTCSGNTPVRNGNSCGPNTAASCNADDMILAEGASACSSCTGETPVRNGNACEAAPVTPPTAGECNANNQILVGEACVACAATQTFENNACRPTVAGDCTATQIFENNACRARTAADCTGETPIFANGSCRARVAADCTAKQVFVDSSKTCRATVKTDCTGATPIFSDGACVAGTASSEQIQEYSKIALNVFNALESQVVGGVLGAHLDRIGEGSGRTASGGAGDAVLEINGTRFGGGGDIAAALASRSADSQHSGEEFALDNFAFSQFGAGGEGAPVWSAWVRGGWGALEGEPLVDGESLRYEGKQFGVYGGVDRQVGNNVRLGLAAGRSEVEIKGDFRAASGGTASGGGGGEKTAGSTAGGLSDKVRREMQSLLPYAEWQKGAFKLRAIGGIGQGDLLINESGDNGCKAKLDVDWLFGGLSGEYRFFESDEWATSLVGDVSYGNSDTGAGVCLSTSGENSTTTMTLSATSGGGGEVLLGAQAAYRRYELGGAYFAPRIGLDARKLFGDVSDDFAYDLSGALTFGRVGGALLFDVEGSWQFNDTTAHRRNNISAQMSYHHGRLSSSLQTRAKHEDALQLSHRLEFGYAGAWGGNRLGGNLYAERSAGGETTPNTTLGGEITLGF